MLTESGPWQVEPLNLSKGSKMLSLSLPWALRSPAYRRNIKRRLQARPTELNTAGIYLPPARSTASGARVLIAILVIGLGTLTVIAASISGWAQ